ncbi:MAG: tRNA (cytidine(34)-2'-O)-methyltransferase [Deltaproteobacteria bacterium]|nr:tRNA (cytidine(34)-2'-O)-methyltransferase [Deltaproteobacteria bacterium]
MFRRPDLTTENRKLTTRFALEGDAPASDGRPRLRCPPLRPPLRVVLVEPEIPPNTGNVARLCAATGSELHLVKPIAFRIDAKAVRRAGLDYWSAVDLTVHDSLDDFLRAHHGPPPLAFSALAPRSYLDAPFAPGASLVFGRESVGLSPAALAPFGDRVFGIPTSGPVRSLNLASAVSIVLYEALRALGALTPARLGAPSPSGSPATKP